MEDIDCRSLRRLRANYIQDVKLYTKVNKCKNASHLNKIQKNARIFFPFQFFAL